MKNYPQIPDFKKKGDLLKAYAQLKHEYGAENIEEILNIIQDSMDSAIQQLKSITAAEKVEKKEPDDLDKIKQLRPDGPRKMTEKIGEDIYKERLEGALLGRFAGCTLGAPVEFWSIDKMKRLARENNMEYPPQNYWSYVPDPYRKRYKVSERELYTRDKMKAVPVDDDITYTILGLLIAEDYGTDFTVKETGEAWLKYLPYAATAEKVALKNLKQGVSPYKSGIKDNPYREWIGAYIRSDPWGYLAPGWPEKAAAMAYQDAYISHRRQGIYGEMFFSAVIAAAFIVDEPLEAIKIGLTEIPENCGLAKAINWALNIYPEINNYSKARETIEKKFAGMSPVHTINNACLTIFGLTIGDRDFTRVIGETVAMGMDNDCTAATAGSIYGARFGKSSIPEYWYKNFNNKVITYLNKEKEFYINDLVQRFNTQRCL
ncbi:MAG: ADP-ribosylglycohydrolase family protein [Bacillota bacterium]